MKDVLSFLFKAKHDFASAAECTVEDVFARFKPLIDGIAAVNGNTSGALLASVLFDFFEECVDVIEDNKLLATVSVERRTGAYMKSGELDKVSDDCLAIAMPYLDFSDRCKVERACHRLFQLSRAVPIHCQRFDEVWNPRMNVLKVARRFKTEVLSFDPKSKWGSDFVTQPIAVSLSELFRDTDTVKELRVGNEDGTQQMLVMTFPNLQRVRVANSVSLMRQMLENNPTVTELHFVDSDFAEDRYTEGVVDWNQDEEAFDKCLSQFRKLRKLTIEINADMDNLDYFNVSAIRQPRYDLSHITELVLAGCYVHTIFHWYWHRQIECLRFKDCVMRSSFDVIPAAIGLKHVALTGCHFEFPEWDESSPPKPHSGEIEKVEFDGYLDDFTAVLQFVNPVHLRVAVTGVGNMDYCLRKLAAYVTKGHLKTLLIDFECNHIDMLSKASLNKFFVWLLQFGEVIARNTQVTLKIKKDLWVEATKGIDGEGLESIDAHVNCLIA